MRDKPLLEDPSEAVIVHLTKAVSTPMREIAVIHIDLALHQAELAAACGIALNLPDLRRLSDDHGPALPAL